MATKTEKLNLRLTAAERDYFSECARRDNIDNMSTWVRKTIWDHLALVGEDFQWFFTQDRVFILHDQEQDATFVCDGRSVFRAPNRSETLFDTFLSKYVRSGIEPRYASIRIARNPETDEEQISEVPISLAKMTPTPEERQEASLVTVGDDIALVQGWNNRLACAFQTDKQTHYLEYHYFRLLAHVARNVSLRYHIGRYEIGEGRLVAFDSDGKLWGLIALLREDLK